MDDWDYEDRYGDEATFAADASEYDEDEDEDEDYDGDGWSDYAERMEERRQMGLTDF